jgi:ATP-dependent protease ClpP protease subunit
MRTQYNEVFEIEQLKQPDDLIQETDLSYKHYIVNLDEEIQEPKYYRKVFDLLRRATCNDIITFIINTPGGNISTLVQFFNHLMITEAHTVADIYEAYSCGADIALSCDSIMLNDFSSMLIHSASYQTEGKQHEINSNVECFDKVFTDILKKIYKGFLTEKEIKSVLEGKDKWFDKMELERRFKKWKPLRSRERN